MEPTNQPSQQRIREIAKTILIILLVVALGIFAVNQILKFFYNSQLLQSPCELCADLNKEQASCIQNCFHISVPIKVRRIFEEPAEYLDPTTNQCYSGYKQNPFDIPINK